MKKHVNFKKTVNSKSLSMMSISYKLRKEQQKLKSLKNH